MNTAYLYLLKNSAPVNATQINFSRICYYSILAHKWDMLHRTDSFFYFFP